MTTNDIDRYISNFPNHTQELLEQLRDVIQMAAPEAEEVISYSMPAFRQNGMLVYYAGCKNHIGFYPTLSGITNFKQELLAFKGTKGSVHFPLDKPLPIELITQIVQFRVNENMAKAKTKAKK